MFGLLRRESDRVSYIVYLRCDLDVAWIQAISSSLQECQTMRKLSGYGGPRSRRVAAGFF